MKARMLWITLGMFLASAPDARAALQISQVLGQPGGPVSVAIGDFDRDGKQDAAIIVYQLDQLRIFRGLGNGQIQPFGIYAMPSGPVYVAAGDVNGDGILDLIDVNNGANSISVLIGNGDGTLHRNPDLSAPYRTSAVAIGDMNGDGKPDLMVAAHGDGTRRTVSEYIGNGNGTFQPQRDFVAGLGPVSVAIGDLNHDGKLDFVTSNYGEGNGNTISVFLATAGGNFLPRVDYLAATGPFELKLADFNGDGTLDVVTANDGSGTVAVLLGNPNGTFQPRTQYAIGAQSLSVTVADFNRDGALDLAVSSAHDNTITTLFGRGDGTFGNYALNSLPAGPWFSAAGDLNGDSWPDLVVPSNYGNAVTVLMNEGVLTPVALSNLSASASSNGVLVSWSWYLEPSAQFEVQRSERRDGGYQMISGAADPRPTSGGFEFYDLSARPGTSYYYRVRYSLGGSAVFAGPVEVRTLEGRLSVRVASNPSRGRVELRYEVPGSEPGELRIYDASGREVRRFAAHAGSGDVSWDGRGADGETVSAGIYFARLGSRTGLTGCSVILLP